MRRNILIALIGWMAVVSIAAAQPNTLWTQTFGGSSYDYGYSVQQTGDGGYIIAGVTESYGAGSNDVYLIKTDSSGIEQWSQTFGGSDWDEGNSVQQTSDGGYIVAGSTWSYGAGCKDVYLIKTDASGDTLWAKTFGGSSDDDGYSVQQTGDGGYIIAGVTESYGAGGIDVYLIKTDSSAIEQWSQTFGGSGDDESWSVQQTSDGGYIIAGYTWSYGAGDNDVYLIKTDASGDTIWTNTFGGRSDDVGCSVQQTSDGGYIIAGYTSSYGAGSTDFYLIKTGASGNEQWSQTYGGRGFDETWSAQQTSDGGYIIAGYTSSYGAGGTDFYLVKTDSSGMEQWSQNIGGSYEDKGYSVQQTSDVGYIIAGHTCSYGTGNSDVWLIRLESEGAVHDVGIQLTYLSGSPVPPGGGPIDYLVTIFNNETNPVIFDAWIGVTIPSGTEFILANRNLTLPASGTISRALTLNVPGSAPAGIYTMTGYVGDYPSGVWNSSTFTFEKSGEGDGLVRGDLFTLNGWDEAWTAMETVPENIVLLQIRPNPFNPIATLSFSLPQAAKVRLNVYDISGRQVASLIDGWREAGVHDASFDGSNLASGVYIYRLSAGGFSAAGKMVLMK